MDQARHANVDSMKVVLCEGDAALVVRSTGEVVLVFDSEQPRGKPALAVLALGLAANNEEWMERAMKRAKEMSDERGT